MCCAWWTAFPTGKQANLVSRPASPSCSPGRQSSSRPATGSTPTRTYSGCCPTFPWNTSSNFPRVCLLVFLGSFCHHTSSSSKLWFQCPCSSRIVCPFCRVSRCAGGVFWNLWILQWNGGWLGGMGFCLSFSTRVSWGLGSPFRRLHAGPKWWWRQVRPGTVSTRRQFWLQFQLRTSHVCVCIWTRRCLKCGRPGAYGVLRWGLARRVWTLTAPQAWSVWRLPHTPIFSSFRTFSCGVC